MAMLKVCALLAILCLLFLHNTNADPISPSPSPLPLPPANPVIINCGVECARRCSRTKRPNLCKRACGSCCFVCKCVPPGTYGNYEACPCYYDLTTRKKVRKCP